MHYLKTLLLLTLLLAGCTSGSQPPAGPATPTNGAAEDSGQAQRLYFSMQQEGQFDIFVADSSGANIRPLIESPGDDVEPSLSPDGKLLAYAHSDETGGSGLQLYLHDLNSGESRPIFSEPTNAIDFAPSWSPDGTQIAFQRITESGGMFIYVINSDGSGERRLTGMEGNHIRPIWSADGQQVIFASNAVARNFDLFITSANEDNPQQLFTLPGDQDWPAISPDGSKIVFSDLKNGASVLMVSNLDGSDLQEVLKPPHGLSYAVMPSWVDNDTLVFAGFDTFNWKIIKTQIDGSDQMILVERSGQQVANPILR